MSILQNNTRYPGSKARRAFRTLTLLTLLVTCGAAHAERVRDLATVAGVRNNQLVGYGLVVGLDGTGDQTTQTPFTVLSIENMLEKFGVRCAARNQQREYRQRAEGAPHAGAGMPCVLQYSHDERPQNGNQGLLKKRDSRPG